MNDDLPEGWRETTLGEVCIKPQYGWTCKAATKGNVKYVRTSDISRRRLVWGNVPYCGSVPDDFRKYRVQVNDILVSRAGSVGISQRIREAPYEAVFASYLIRFRALENVLPEWIEYYLKSDAYWRSISEMSAGIALQNVNASKLSALELPLPPLPEQRRIVAKLEELLGKVDACQSHLAKIPLILKRFRQSVLAAACSGKLTEDWRRQHGKGGSDLQSDEESNGMGEIPSTWKWLKIQEVCQSIVDCPHSTPKWTAHGKICVRTTNFRPNQLDLSEVRFVSEKTFRDRVGRLTPHAGDVLYSREGGILGIACMIPKGIELCLGQRMMLLRTKETYSGSLLMYWLNTPQIMQKVRDLTGGTASPHLNVGDIKEFWSPLPPPEEQREIIGRVGLLLALADQIETRCGQTRERVARMYSSSLSQAFHGEL